MKYFLLILSIILFLTRVITYEHFHRIEIPKEWLAGSVELTGIIVEDPDRGIDRTRIVVQPDFPEWFLQNHRQAWRILITLPMSFSGNYGDKISFSGTLRIPEPFVTETGRMFNYKKYLASNNIGATMTLAEVTLLERDLGNLFLKNLFTFKQKILGLFKNLLPQHERGLLAGILLGEKSLLPKEILSDFQIAGLTHIMVLSGSNITIVGLCMVEFFALLGFGYRSRRLGALLVIPCFVMMTGLDASAIRAGCMTMLLFGSQIMVRFPYQSRVIIIVAGGMVFHNPRILLYSPSFHLSFLAYIGLVYAVPRMKSFLESWIEKRWPSISLDHFLIKLFIETSTIQLFVLPYIIWMQGKFSLVMILANLATVPLIPGIMALGTGMIIAGFLWTPLGSFFGIITKIGLGYILDITHYLAGLSGFIITIPIIPLWVMIIIYGILTLFIINSSKNTTYVY